jgi:DNA polymerase III subunit gamma/tau
MSNQEKNIALYTKYRPQKFKDVLGQEHVVAPLTACIENDNIAHAYIFAGPRGTGKTSIARIFAREIETKPEDIYEIDAASNTGVEDVRDLNESVKTLPFNSRYKVYILDEAHMMSKSAFNALLKTIEEPPEHVIFILATTELHKLPETIISRCETYQFKSPNRNILKKMAIKTAEKEGYQIDPATAELIAILGDGSFRDTHTILQKVIRSSADKKLSLEEVEKITGAPKNKLINNIVEAYAENEREVIFENLNKLTIQNIDEQVFIKLFLEKSRAIMLLKLAPNLTKHFQDIFSEEDLKFLENITEHNSANFNAKNLLIFLEANQMIFKTNIPYLSTEIAFAKILDE